MESIVTKILNTQALFELEEEIEHLKDVHEKEIRGKLLEAIWGKLHDYDMHILEYEYKQHIMALSERGLTFVPVEKHPIEAQWDELFIPLVIEQSKAPVNPYNDQFKWHLFSFELLNALKEDDARATFDTIEKDTVYLFFQNSEDAYLVKNASLLKAKDLDFDSGIDKSDLYVFDPFEKWTYAKTHEYTCGPYFYRTK